jgi:hypothetical protein
VRDALSRIGRSLPDNVDDPVIFKADSDAQPVMQLAVTSDAMSMGDLSKLVEDTISERLGAVAGVAEVQVYGTRDTAFDVDVDPIKLASHGLTVADVRTALATIALDTPTGSINGPNQNITVRAISEVTTPQDFEDIVIKGRTLLGDVASVVFDASASTSSLRSNGKPGIGLGIGIGLEDHRVIDIVGQGAADAAEGVAHVGGRDIEVRAVGKFEGDAALAGRGAGGNAGDALHAGDGAFHHGSDFAVHGFGGSAGEGGGNGEDGLLDAGQFAHFGAEQGGKAGHHDHGINDDCQDRPPHEQCGQGSAAFVFFGNRHAVLLAISLGWRRRPLAAARCHRGR